MSVTVDSFGGMLGDELPEVTELHKQLKGANNSFCCETSFILSSTILDRLAVIRTVLLS